MKNSQEFPPKTQTPNTVSSNDGNRQKENLAEIKYLATSWLDQFEQEMFDGKTLNELLKEPTYE